MSVIGGILDSFIYIAGVAALTPFAILLAAIIGCNAWELAKACKRKIHRSIDSTQDWWL
jgi:hypothetical protein